VIGHAHVSLRGIVKRFGAFTALKSVDLDIARGEFVCFLGPSGCGKTTLLRAIAGLDQQDEGRIEMGGRDVSHAPPSERDFGIVFQSYALFPNLTVAANIGYGLVNRGKSSTEIATRVNELLGTVGLADQAQKYPVQLSGGQQQRVALARALATSPSLLLLDEPLSALDAKVRVRLREELRSLQRRLGVTTIMVTHDQEEALALADRIVVMNQGQIDQVGTPTEIYRQPSTPYVADFVGTMSFLTATMSAPHRATLGGHELPVESDYTVGQKVTLAIRPEAARLESPPNGGLPGSVADIAFLGSFVRVKVDGPEGQTLLVDVPADHAIPQMGEKVSVRLPQEAIRVFEAKVS